MAEHLPPGWPTQVPPPGTRNWAERAALWLLDHSPAEYRQYPVMRKHPVLLVWLAEHNVAAQLDATRRSYGRARAELAEQVAPQQVTELLETLEQEGARLLALQREIGLVASALRGEPYVPRL